MAENEVETVQLQLSSTDPGAEHTTSLAEGESAIVRIEDNTEALDQQTDSEVSFRIAADSATFADLLARNGTDYYVLDEQVEHHLEPVGATGGGLDFGFGCYAIVAPTDGTYAATITRELARVPGTVTISVDRTDSVDLTDDGSGTVDDGSCILLD